MKTLLLAATFTLSLFSVSHAQDKDAKKPAAAEETKKGGPTGGRVITAVEPHAEFTVTKDKKAEVRFLDKDNKVVAPGTQVVTATMGDRTNPTKLTFTKDGDKLVSDKAVPEGNDYPTVVQIKADAKAKTVNEKFNLNLSKCPTCSFAEYACVCEHGADEHEDHKDDAKKKK